MRPDVSLRAAVNTRQLLDSWNWGGLPSVATGTSTTDVLCASANSAKGKRKQAADGHSASLFSRLYSRPPMRWSIRVLLHCQMSAPGTKRRFAAVPMLTAIGGEADIGRASRSCRSGAIDPKETLDRMALPNKPRGVPRVNDRRVLNGIFWMLESRAWTLS